MRQIGHEVKIGARSMAALSVVTALAVLREGSETVLFLYSFAVSGSLWASTFTGAALGVGAGALAGWLLYRGLLAIPISRFFTVVSWLVVLLASGLAATAAGYLYQASLVPALGFELWDTSRIVAQDSWVGTLLHILVGYADRPMGIQLLFYACTLLTILSLMMIAERSRTVRPSKTRPVC